MKNVFTLCSLVVTLITAQLYALPLGTAFTFQGRLDEAGRPVSGTYYLYFELYDAPSGGNRIGTQPTNTVNVANGVFTVDLDFGTAAFTGEARWLQVNVRTNGGVGSDLSPRTAVTPAPNAIYASKAGNVVNGAIQAAHLATIGAAGPGQMLGYDGTSLVWLPREGFGTVWALNGTSAYYNDGKVGIGTTLPSGKLSVVTADDFAPTLITGFDGRHAVIGTPAQGIGFSYSANNGAGYISALAPGVAWKDLVLQARSLTFNLSGEKAAISVLDNGDLRTGPLISVASDFFLGHPDRRGIPGRALVDLGSALHLNYNADWTDTVIGGRFLTAVATDFLLGHPTRRGSPGHALVDFTDTLHINFGGDWANTFIGGSNVSVCTLTIRGGCDLAEPFQMTTPGIPEGSVVVIDDENAGKLKLSDRAYDHRVAGIVSGANGVSPGIALHQEGVMEGGQNVALTGRVYVQADASSGPIKPGDLLTTSDTPGHAMKVADHVRAQGAIIGKAMSALTQGKGTVLVLVSLQ